MVVEGGVAVLLDEFVAFGALEVFTDHFGDEFVEGGLRRPAKLFFGFGRVAKQGFNFGGAEVARVDFDDDFAVLVGAGFLNALPLPGDLDAEFFGGGIDELAHAVLHAGGDDEVFGFVLLQHQPLRFDVVLGVAPVAQGVHVAEVEAVLQVEFDACQGARDLTGDKGFAAQRGFMVEEDAVTGVEAVGFAVIYGDPVGVHLGHGVGAARVEGGGFLLRGFLDETVELGGAGLVEAGFLFEAENADGFEDAQGADAVGVGGVFGGFKADRDVAHGGEVVDFVGLHLLNDADEVGRVGQVAVVQDEILVLDVRVLVQVVDAVGVEERGTALDAVNDIALLEQEFGKVGAVLAGDAGNECGFGHDFLPSFQGERL